VDVFQDLPIAKWRDIEFPLLGRKAHFDHEIVKHKLQYKDLEVLEALGLHNWVFEYTIPFREDIRKGHYDHLFIEVFPKFLDACRDRKPGKLIDPVLGVFQARCVSLEDTSDVMKRDGDDVSVMFIQSPPSINTDEDFVPAVLGLDATVHDADRIDDEVSRIDDATLAKAGLNRPSVSGGADLLSSIAGFGQQIAAAGNRVGAQISGLEQKLANIERAFDAVNDQAANPLQMPAIRAVRRLIDQTTRLGQKALLPGAQLGSRIVTADTPVGTLAQSLKQPLALFMILNPTMPRPLVTAGTIVKFILAKTT
jgi:hypothetical protein